MTFGPRPQVDGAFLDELASFFDRNEQPSPDTIAACRRRGEALLNTEDAAWGWVTLVACASASWDREQGIALAERAIAAIGPNPTLMCNLAVSFKHMNQIELSHHYSSWAFSIAPYYPEAVKCFCDDLMMLGKVSQGLETVRTSISLKASEEDEKLIAKFAARFETVQTAMESSKISEHQLGMELDAAFQTLYETRTRYSDFRLYAEDEVEEGGVSLTATIRFIGDLDEEFRLAALLTSKLSNMPEWDPCSLNTSFLYKTLEDVDASH